MPVRQDRPHDLLHHIDNAPDNDHLGELEMFQGANSDLLVFWSEDKNGRAGVVVSVDQAREFYDALGEWLSDKT